MHAGGELLGKEAGAARSGELRAGRGTGPQGGPPGEEGDRCEGPRQAGKRGRTSQRQTARQQADGVAEVGAQGSAQGPDQRAREPLPSREGGWAQWGQGCAAGQHGCGEQAPLPPALWPWWSVSCRSQPVLSKVSLNKTKRSSVHWSEWCPLPASSKCRRPRSKAMQGTCWNAPLHTVERAMGTDGAARFILYRNNKVIKH